MGTFQVVTPDESASTNFDHDANRSELGLLPRLIAAGWFAAAACIPVVFFLLTFGQVLEKGSGNLSLAVLWIFAEVPIVTAAFFGFTFGSRIVDPVRDTNTVRAALQGIGVSGFSYLVFMGFYLTSFAVQYHGDKGFLLNVILAMIMVSLLVIGWLIVLAGALAGLLLCRYSCRAEVLEVLVNAPRVSARKSYAMAVIAAALVVMSAVIGGMLWGTLVPKY